jgi:hypothetical protein
VSQEHTFNFQSNKEGRAVTFMVVRFLCGSQWKDLILDLTDVLFVFLLTCTYSEPLIFFLS